MATTIFLFEYTPLRRYLRHPHGKQKAIVYRSVDTSYGHYESNLELMAEWFERKEFDVDLHPITIPGTIKSRADGGRFDPLPQSELDRFKELYKIAGNRMDDAGGSS